MTPVAQAMVNGSSSKHGGDENEGSFSMPLHDEDDEQTNFEFGPNQQWWRHQEEIVISGISGRMPESNNMQEFADNLYNGVDMITEDNRRWEPGFYDLPTRHGKLKEIRKFDAGFFGVHPKQAANMDPQLRILLEASYEAIIDAGVNPQDLRGTNCGVFVANSASETTSVLTSDPETIVGYALTGCARSMFSSRISYAFDLRGPSFTVDTACSSSLLAFQLAVDAIREGQCENALVCGAHVTLTPNSALQFLRLTMLSPDGKCMSFDANGNGYVRAECVGAILLQKVSQARRHYASVVHAKSNTDGYKEQGITFPSREQQRRLLLDTYKEAGLNPKNVVYVEAHGTGTKIGDPQECNALTSVFCRDRQGSLLIGSVKSNGGHAEPSSGIMSLAKVVLAMEKGVIPQNLHYREPNPNIAGLLDGRLKVISKNTPWVPGYVGINSFGFGGSNTHVILKPTSQKNETVTFLNNTVPLLVLYPGRTQKGVENVFRTFEANKLNVALYDVMCNQSYQPTNQCCYRGYYLTYPHGKRVVSETNNNNNNSNNNNNNNNSNNDSSDNSQVDIDPGYDIQKVPITGKRPVFLVYSGMGSQWAGMGRELMSIPLFREVVEKCSAVIEQFGISPKRLITEGTDKDFQNNTLNCFLAICTIQMALTDLLRYIGVEADGIIGHSTGEMASSYADGCTTHEETMKIAYYRGKTIMGASFPLGAMAAVGLSWEQTIRRVPIGVFPACHNAPDSVTVSGDAKKIAEFVDQLQSEGIFAKMVDSSGIAFHSPCMQSIAHEMRKCLNTFLLNPKPRSKKWISSSIPEDQWSSDVAKFSSTDYHVNNMVSVVLFHEAMKKLPKNAVIIEVAPHCLLQAVLKRGMPTGCQTFGLMSARHPNNVEYLLQSLGKLYQAGLNLKIHKLYPRPTAPLPRGTPMLGSLVSWDHSQTWDVFTGPMKGSKCECSYTVDPFSNDSKEQYVLDHYIDGRVIYPFTGYLVLAWKALCKLNGLDWQKTPIVIDNVICHRATIMTKPVKFDICITSSTGFFEILDEGSLACNGYIRLMDDEPDGVGSNKPFFYQNIDQYPEEPDDDGIRLNTPDLYKEFQLRGYEYGPAFRGIVEARNTGSSAMLAWTGNWVTFIDTLLQTNLIYEKGDTLRVPIRLKYMRIDPIRHVKMVEDYEIRNGDKSSTVKVIKIRNHFATLGVIGGGVEARDLACQTVPKRSQSQRVTLERIYFTPYFDANCLNDFPVLRDELSAYNRLCKAQAIHSMQQLLKQPSCLLLKDVVNCRSTFEKIVRECPVSPIDQNLLNQCLADDTCVWLKTLVDISNDMTVDSSSDEKLTNNGELLTNGSLQNGNGSDFYKALNSQDEYLNAKMSSSLITLLTRLEVDRLWSACWNDRPAKDLFDVVVENTAGHFMKVAAIDPVSPNVLKCLRSMHQTHPLLDGEYTLIGPNVDGFDQDFITSNRLQAYRFETSSVKDKISNEYLNQDLIILDRNLHRQMDPATYLTKIGQFLRDDGFVLVAEVTSNYEAAFALAVASGEPLTRVGLNGGRKYGLFFDNHHLEDIFTNCGFKVVGQKSHDDLPVTLFLLHKTSSSELEQTFVKINDVQNFSWVEPLQKIIDERLNEPAEKTIWLLSDEIRDNGAVGLTLCLREENQKVNRIRCLADLSHKQRSGPPALHVDDPAVKKIIDNNLLLNLYRDGVWGTIKHLVVKDEQQYTYVDTEHAFVNTLVRGDLSSLAWVESRLKYHKFIPMKPTEDMCSIYCTSLNFRDIMLATGRLSTDAIPDNLIERDCLLGIEYVGRLHKTGKRVMGILGGQAMATSVISDRCFSWDVPDHWTMEEAATIPAVYSTCYYALLVRGRMKPGNKVLIHSGSGGVGQAAINIALSMGCEVFTTVSTEEKKAFLKSRYPELKDDHFANSRTTDFEFKIMQVTHGKGVDIVLNSLSDDKLQASLRCLAQHGKFLEIGKFDLANNSNMGMYVFMKNVTVHGVLVDSLFNPYSEDWGTAAELLRQGIENGTVKPLPATVFSSNQLEEAFRFMAQGKHVGKIVLKIREEENQVICPPSKLVIKAVRRTLCNPNHVYIMIGGLGGIGLELTQWLFSRGGRKFILTSRSGVKTGYQQRYLKCWRKNGAQVVVSSLDISDYDQTVQLIKEAQAIGPVGGIFNLAMILRDTLFENQTIDNFTLAALPKYYGTKNLDKATRVMCDSNLKWFVAFSSLACGRGNAGQTSYGWSNSTMERIVEQRRFDGLPGIAVQWGAVGDVGVILENMGDNSTVVGGSVPQRIASCMQSLDLFLCMDHPLVSSFIKSEMQSKSGPADTDVLNAIAHILGVSDPSQLNPDANLADLGLDSLMGVEIKQALERDYDIVLSMKDIRTLTLSKLKMMAKGGPKVGKTEADSIDTSPPDIAAQIANFEEQAALERALTGGFRLRIHLDGLRPEIICVKLNDLSEGSPVFFLHSIEGIGSTLKDLAKELPYPAYCFQCTPDAPSDSIENLALFYVEEMRRIQPKGPYRIVGYSYGACIAFEMAVYLQKLNDPNGQIHSLILLDGSYRYMKLYRIAYRRYYNVSSENLRDDPLFESEILCGVILRFVATDYKTIRSEFTSLPSIRERIDKAVQMLMATGQFKDKQITEFALEAFWRKMIMADLYHPKDKYQGDMTLVRAKIGAAREEDIGHDYGLGELVTGKVVVHVVEGDHDSFIHDESAVKTAAILTDYLSRSSRP